MPTPLNELEALVHRLSQQAYAEGYALAITRVIAWLLAQSKESDARERDAGDRHDSHEADCHSAQSSAYALAAHAIGAGKHEVKT